MGTLKANALNRVMFRLKHQGLGSLIVTIFRKIFESIKPSRIQSHMQILEFINGAKGLEIGGPSYIFSKKGFLPIYEYVDSMDNLNYSAETIWEGEIKNELFIYNGRTLGNQYIRDAVDLHGLPDSGYNFVVSSEMIQHIANPLRALYEWKRVLKPKGHLVLIVPNKERTFDHKRPVTTLSHMIDDYNSNMQEDDLTHLQEALELHDLSRDMPAGTFEQFRKRSEENVKYRALHHHIFDTHSIVELLQYAGFDILTVDKYLAAITVVAVKE